VSELLPVVEVLPKSHARRDAILDAARQVFINKGFELTTIQDIATSCGMSPGNLYRYFASKSDIVSGLVERDRAQMAQRFAELAAAPDQIESFEKLARQHLRDECLTHAKLTLEIWAASARRPELRQICVSMEEAVIADLKKFLGRISADNLLAPGADPDVICHIIMALAQAMFRDSALKPDHNINHDLDVMLAVVGAAMAGHVKIPQHPDKLVKAAE
jgi:TetR/AcrR family transcriptional regulator, repressor for uid operon